MSTANTPAASPTRTSERALVLWAVDSRSGEWLTCEAIAARTCLPADRVHLAAGELVAGQLLLAATRNGAPVYGVRTEGVAP